jgi:hypothetical protein
MKQLSKLFAAGALLAAAQTNALVIDFGATPWTPGANNESSYSSYYDLTGNVTVEAGPAGRTLFANDPEDGLGVNNNGSREHDELEHDEYISIVFERAVNLVSIRLTDLFPFSNHADNNNFDGFSGYGEIANIEFWLNGTNVTDIRLIGNNSTAQNGDQTWLAPNGLVVDKIIFRAPDSIVAGHSIPWNEYSVKAIEVPEPGIFALLGLGLMGLGLSRRRQSK